MSRLVCAFALLAAALSWAACSPPFAIFQDVGTDPHPPQLAVVGMAYQPVEGEDGTAPEPVILPVEGFEIRTNDATASTVLLRVQYADLGGDVETIFIRDRDGSYSAQAVPTAPEVDIDGDGDLDTLTTPSYLTGTAGTVDIQDIELGANMAGSHRLEIWAEDSHGSRSEKLEFTVTVVL